MFAALPQPGGGPIDDPVFIIISAVVGFFALFGLILYGLLFDQIENINIFDKIFGEKKPKIR